MSGELLRFPKPKDLEGRLAELTDAEYAELRRQVWLEQEGHCAACPRSVPLLYMHLHHKKHRKAGGGSTDHSRDNVEGLCPTCHKKQHPGV